MESETNQHPEYTPVGFEINKSTFNINIYILDTEVNKSQNQNIQS